MIQSEYDVCKILIADWASRSLYVAVKMGIIDALEKGPLDIADLARRAGAKEEALYRVLSGVVRLGVLEEPNPGLFRLTAVGRCLRTGDPSGLASFAIMLGEEFRDALSDLEGAIRTGGASFDRVHGARLYEYLRARPERSRLFGDAMKGLARHSSLQMMSEHDFAPYRRIVDVGGGDGYLLATILSQNPAAHGVLFDQHHVIAAGSASLESAGVLSRCERIGGDFFESVPPGGDLYVLSKIIHNYDDSRAQIVLRACRRAIAPGGRLLLVEVALGSDREPELGRHLDLVMLVLTGGRERTAKQMEALLSASGFNLLGIKAMQPMTCLIEAAPTESP